MRREQGEEGERLGCDHTYQLINAHVQITYILYYASPVWGQIVSKAPFILGALLSFSSLTLVL